KWRWLFPHYLVLGELGLALAVAYQEMGLFGIVVFALPAAMMQLVIKQYLDRTTASVVALQSRNEELREANQRLSALSDEVQRTYRGTLEALVNALDARDREVHGHSVRVTKYTTSMARYLGIMPGTREWE